MGFAIQALSLYSATDCFTSDSNRQAAIQRRAIRDAGKSACPAHEDIYPGYLHSFRISLLDSDAGSQRADSSSIRAKGAARRPVMANAPRYLENLLRSPPSRYQLDLPPSPNLQYSIKLRGRTRRHILHGETCRLSWA